MRILGIFHSKGNIQGITRQKVIQDLERVGYRVPFFSTTVHKLRQLTPEKYNAYLKLFDNIYKSINFDLFNTKPKLWLYLPSVEELKFMKVDLLVNNIDRIKLSFLDMGELTLDLKFLPDLYKTF